MMKSPRIWTAAAALLTSHVASQRLWCAGRVFEERTDIHKDYPVGDFRQVNSVWNAATKTVSLKAARNAFVAIQVIVEATQPAAGLNVKFPGLIGPNGASIAGKDAAVFKEWYVDVRHVTTGYERSSLGPGWYPDALILERRAHLYSGFPFFIPDLYNNIPDQKNQALCIDLFVPLDRKVAPAGRYSGDFEVSALVQTREWRAMMKRCNGSSRSKIFSKDGTSIDKSSFCA